ncbi:MAG: hypothetical protein Tsb0020_23970 [Haliangiales bacterium]
MSAADLYAELLRRGVHLRTDGDRLRLQAPPGALTDELRRRVTQQKQALLALVARADAAAAADSVQVDDDATFPLTDTQEAYWVGRSGLYGSGGFSPYAYLEIEGDELDLSRLEHTWQQVIRRHPMLRAVVIDGVHHVLEQVPAYSFAREDLSTSSPAQVDARLAALRDERARRVFAAERWPLFEIRALRMPAAGASRPRLRLCVCVDLLIADGMSVFVALRDWGALYRGEELPPLTFTFRDYVLREREARRSGLYRDAEAYWRERASSLPPAPEVPHVPSAEPSRFVHRTVRLDAERWRALQERARRAGLTPSACLCAAYAEVLLRWSKSPRFTLNLTVSSRPPYHADIDRVVGEFTSTLLLEIAPPAGSFAERARALGERLTRDLDHARVSGVSVLRAINRERASDDAALMPFVFTSHIGHWYGRAEESPVAWLGRLVYSSSQTPQVWLDHIVIEDDAGLAAHWDAAENRFPPGLIDAMCESYGALLTRLAEDDDAWHQRCPAPLPAAQRDQRERYNATAGPLPGALLQDGFLDQVDRDGAAIAIAAPDRRIRYDELSRRVNRLAAAIADDRTGNEPLVAVVLEKGWEQVVACLGVLVAGAAYLPIDPSLPAARVRYLLEVGEVAVAVTHPDLADAGFWPPQVRRVVVEQEPPPAGEYERPPARVAPRAAADDLAYVIFTSGSSGRPKGVSISHRGARNTIDDIGRRFAVTAEDRVFALSSLSFDLSVYDVFGTLAAGACVVFPRASAASDPAHWRARLAEEGVTVWNSVPALAELLVAHPAGHSAGPGGDWSARLRLVMLSGDWIPTTLPDRLRSLAPGARVISLGGATEASIWSIYYPVDAVEPAWTSIPYGRPLANQTIHVLDAALAPCPDWVPGELYIGGAGVALGYWKDPERTAAQFLRHPTTGERLYRTGDWGRFHPQGYVEFLGREDHQVKIAGYRIELGEIEAALLRDPTLRQAFASVVGDTGDVRRLIAHVVPAHGRTADADALRDALAESLPAWMVPSEIVVIEAAPYSANGKIDRRALMATPPLSPPPARGAAPSAGGPGQRAPHAPDDPRARIRRLVASLVDERDADADGAHFDDHARFVSVGITSIQLIKLASLLEEQLGHRPEMAELLTMDSVARLAAFYEGGAADGDGDGVATASRALTAAGRELGEPWPELLDPERLAAFRAEMRGRRRFDDDAARLRLDGPPVDAALRERHLQRRSHREFAPEPVPQARLGHLLSALRAVDIDGKAKYRYASAHDSRAVQVYVLAKPGRVSDLAGGAYYYDPIAHELVRLAADETDWQDAYLFENREIYAQAAFALFLVVALEAIAPLHGKLSVDYALIEAGAIAQLLESEAAGLDLGLCQCGYVAFDRIGELFSLGPQQMLLHSLLGGCKAWDEGSI